MSELLKWLTPVHPPVRIKSEFVCLSGSSSLSTSVCLEPCQQHAVNVQCKVQPLDGTRVKRMQLWVSLCCHGNRYVLLMCFCFYAFVRVLFPKVLSVGYKLKAWVPLRKILPCSLSNWAEVEIKHWGEFSRCNTPFCKMPCWIGPAQKWVICHFSHSCHLYVTFNVVKQHIWWCAWVICPLSFCHLSTFSLWIIWSNYSTANCSNLWIS